MVDYKKKYQGIVDELIGESFPELKGKRIRVSEGGKFISERCSAATFYLIWLSLIKVSVKLRGYVDNEVKGVLAHELAHIIRIKSCGFFGKLWMGLGYLISVKARASEEKACGKVVIERGYARELFSFKTKRCKKGGYSSCYLTPGETKSYAKEVGKW
jgi:hypothetical protein